MLCAKPANVGVVSSELIATYLERSREELTASRHLKITFGSFDETAVSPRTTSHVTVAYVVGVYPRVCECKTLLR